jgi:hypothetical protein
MNRRAVRNLVNSAFVGSWDARIVAPSDEGSTPRPQGLANAAGPSITAALNRRPADGL